jgi:hypothetical protein
VPFPDFVDRRVDDELQDERGKDAADHLAGEFGSVRIAEAMWCAY